MSENLKTTLQYYGISPWEIEVLYGFLNSHFTVIQDEIEQNDEDFVSSLDIEIPLPFNESFFQWFDFKRWEKVKAIFKEMKRRRGSGNALKIKITFSGNPRIIFTVDTVDRQWFDNAVEKIDSVLELLQYHLDPNKLPSDISEIIYKFDPESIRWRLNTASTENKKYTFSEDSWKEIT
ncbi:MAG TPA: hypothetical protein OQH54_01925 [Nitrosopumilus sp.]|nr:hypothetical protein [Thermoproteota archaeon]HJJ22463.1 hypothetical protein [Nitrosopumilus sp.]